MPTTIKDLLNELKEDKWRLTNPFSESITISNEVLLDPFSTASEKEEAIAAWLQRFQPCIFGKLAAKMKRIHYCFLTDADLREADSVIRGKLDRERKTWKQLALGGGNYFTHSFFLLICSERVLRAAPDNNLKAFALAIQNLVSTDKEIDDYGNDRAFQYVYLKKPTDGKFYKFTVIMDFFASAGDGRWWVDHRVPGGLAFTFNSLGHMVRTQEWHGGETDREAWATKLAMTTIDSAEPHPKYGKATWLKNLENGMPFKPLGCPFKDLGSLPPRLKDKDWTAYEGLHHTDHSVRKEFFNQDDTVPTAARPWRMDFAYIFSRNNKENSDIMDGMPVSEEEIYKDIDKPEDWRIAPPSHVSNPFLPAANTGQAAKIKIPFKTPTEYVLNRPKEATIRINYALDRCRKWRITDEEMKNMAQL